MLLYHRYKVSMQAKGSLVLNLATAKGRSQSRNSRWCDPQSGGPSARTARSGCALSARNSQPNQLNFSEHLNTNTVGIRKRKVPIHLRSGGTGRWGSTTTRTRGRGIHQPPRARESKTIRNGGIPEEQAGAEGRGLRWAGSWYAGPWWTPWLMRRRELPFPSSEPLEAERARGGGAGRANPSWTCGCERARRRGREEGFVPLS